MNNYSIFKKIFIIFFMIFLIFNLNLSFCKEIIKIGYFSLEPHNINENNKHLGAAVDLWEDFIAPEMEVEIQWIGPMPPVRLFDSLKNGEINIIALLAKNEERAKAFDFPNESFFTMEAGVAVLNENKMNKINSINDLANLILGFFKDGFIPQVMRDERIKWDLVSSTDWQSVNFNKLLSKRIDAAFNPESLSLLYEAKRLNVKDKIKVLIIPNTKSELYSVFSKKDNKRFLNKYNKIINNKSIKDKYLVFLKKYL